MKAKVTYNEDGEPYSIRVHYASCPPVLKAKMVGSNAVITAVYPIEGEDCVYTSDLRKQMSYLESLPFVQEANLSMVCDE